jgi:hypothetical protein
MAPLLTHAAGLQEATPFDDGLVTYLVALLIIRYLV